MLFILQDDGAGGSSAFLKFFIDPAYHDVSGAEDVALNWVLTGVVIAFVCTAVMAGSKWLLKTRAALSAKRWRLSRVFGWLLLGWVPILIVLGVIYYLSGSFRDILAVGGYSKGVLFTGLLYALLMIGTDFVIHHFRADYSR